MQQLLTEMCLRQEGTPQVAEGNSGSEWIQAGVAVLGSERIGHTCHSDGDRTTGGRGCGAMKARLQGTEED